MKKLLIACMLLLFSIPALAAVDLNSASQATLETLDGIGPKKARAILEYRKKNGAFKTVDELDNVPGFGKKTVDGLRKNVVVVAPRPAAPARNAPKTAVPAKPVAAAAKATQATKPTTPAAKPVAPATKDKGGKK